MDLQQALNFVPVFLLALFRVGGMMMFAPLFGSAKIPRRVRALLAIILALGVAPAVVVPSVLPTTPWGLAIGIGGEMVFGLVVGTVMSLVFIAVQWAGEIIGQQMGFNLSEVFDPQFGSSSSLIGDMYFMLLLVIFLCLRGHHAMLQGLVASFAVLPPLSVGMSAGLLSSLAGTLEWATVLAFQLAAPMLVSMLIVDLVLGFLGKTMPQMNIMTAGLSIRSFAGMLVLIVGLVLTSDVMSSAVLDSMGTITRAWGGLK
jgi:flagellar biosynthesis protein FliR